MAKLTEKEKQEILAKVAKDKECSCCAIDQFQAGEPFRELDVLPVLGERKGVEFYHCSVCDAPSLT